MGNSNRDIAHRPVDVNIKIKKDPSNNDIWLIEPTLTAFPNQKKPDAKNLVFVLDTSPSMGNKNRLKLVKEATKNLLDQLETHDTFSIISFSTNATCIINKLVASDDNISTAKNAIDQLETVSNGGTDFTAAFETIKNTNLISSTNNSSIIFLTDGEDTSRTNCTSKDLQNLVTINKNTSRIIPIGIALDERAKARTLLTQLATKNAKPIFINDGSQKDYLDAFQKAFNLTIEQSKTPVAVEIMIEAKDKTNSTRCEYKRELSIIHFDGEQKQGHTFYFESPVPPTSCNVRFICDGIILQGNHRFTPTELKNITHSKSKSIAIDQLKWKDHSISSWLKCLFAIGFGLLLLAGSVTLFLMAFFSFSLTLTIGIPVGALGLSLLTYGLADLYKKTVFVQNAVMNPTSQPTRHNIHLPTSTHPNQSDPTDEMKPAPTAQSAPQGKASNSGQFSTSRTSIAPKSRDQNHQLKRRSQQIHN